VIILLNFLIAFISETYEEVYSKEKVDEFTIMAKLNLEFRVMTRPYALIKNFKLRAIILVPILILSKAF